MVLDSVAVAKQFALEIRVAAVCGAQAYAAIHGHRCDDISENEAYKTYGKAWIKSRLAEGSIHFYRIGSGQKSTKYYSVFEIETLKRAEKHIEQVYNEALMEHKNQN